MTFPFPGILVSRAQDRLQATLYPFNLREPIPTFPLLLQPDDPKPAIDLQPLLQAIYDEAALDLVIDYHQPPSPPVPDSDGQWLQTYLPED